MTDGPHKSLPLGRPWKKVAMTCANENYSMDDICGELDRALRSDLAGIPFGSFNQAYAGDGLPSLFPLDTNERLRRLDSCYGACRGSEPALQYINSLMASALSGVESGDAFKVAMEMAVKTTLQSKSLGIVEHYKREGANQECSLVLSRLAEASRLCDAGVFGREVNRDGKVAAPSRGSRKRTDLDDGPSLGGGEIQ